AAAHGLPRFPRSPVFPPCLRFGVPPRPRWLPPSRPAAPVPAGLVCRGCARTQGELKPRDMGSEVDLRVP
ncbi:hypothetical protein STRIP9103_08051, partial [Streptomyces ipomoeae 91-03]